MLPFLSHAQNDRTPPPPPPPNGQQPPRRSPEERAKHQTEWMRKDLGINDQQANKAYEILYRHAQMMDEDRGMPKGQGKRADMRQANATRDRELQGVLTQEQYQRYMQHEQEMKQRRQQERRPQQGGY